MDKFEVLINKLDTYKNKTITLYELYKIGCLDDDIYKLLEIKKLTIIKSSGTNGNLRKPLYNKYRIIKEEKDYSDLLPEIRKLHPKLTANCYLTRNPESYLENKSIITALSDYLVKNELLSPLSRRERSLLIFNDEKILDNNISLLSSLGITDKDLAFYATPEYCFVDYIPKRKDYMKLLICENKDIWFDIRRLMSEELLSEIFGVSIDGVIFGQGNYITKKDYFLSYARFLSANKIEFLYCGDIDRAGFDIFCRFTDECNMLDIKLFLPVYLKMLELADIEKLPDSEDNRNIALDYDRFINLFDNKEQIKIKKIFDMGKRLPQEIINYSVLKANMR